MNVCVMRGNISTDVDVRYSKTKNGETCVAHFGLAVNNPFSREKKADFFNCVGFGKTGEFCEKFFTKGQAVCVKGRLVTNNYTNKKGEKVYGYQLILEEVDFASNKEKSKQDGFEPIPDAVENDLPFN